MDRKMKIRFFTAIGFSLMATLFVAFYPTVIPPRGNPDTQEKEILIIRGVVSALDQLHYSPLEMNDALSERAFNNYLDRLDSGKRFLTQSDIDKLLPFKKEIDNQYLDGKLDFFNLSVEVMDEAVVRPESWYKELLAQPFDFEKEESIVFDGDERGYARDEEELKDFWRKSLKYEVLTKLYSRYNEQEKNDTISDKKTFDQLEEEARADVLKTFDGIFSRVSKLRRSDRFSDYLNSFTELYDPHTNYYDPKDKEDFDINMAGRVEGIGARLQTDGEYTKVESIVPGGPAWKQKQLEPNDQILKVAQQGEDAVDIRGMRIDDVVKQVRGKKGTTVILTVRKADGSTENIAIVRDEVILDEGFAKSAILEHSEIIDQIGYIKLPRFYADFERKDGNSCSKDVAIEIEKLKAKNVKGIILDLRNNGGGSLRDVIDMSGLFIESGPIVQVKARNQRPQVLRDGDSGVQYAGPLIVMVNSFSASASEILAAALQDYDRALIVGGVNTFGKGTVQRFYDLDRLTRGYPDLKPLGEIKVTMQKFYRINGGSTQLKGVEPDIVLPDLYMKLEIGEREYEHPMEWSEIEPLVYDQNVFKLKNKHVLQQLSTERIMKDTSFSLIAENANRFHRQRNQKEFPLKFESYASMMEKREKESMKFENIMKEEIEGFRAKNLPEDLAGLQIDEAKVERNEKWLESLRKDIYLKETLHLMSDMMQNL